MTGVLFNFNIEQLRKQEGNALFLILIAVALFAALSYAITQSGRGGGGAGREQADLKAARLFQRAAEIQNAYTRLTLINGCNLDALEWDAFNDNPADHPGPCNIYDQTQGGGAIYKVIPDGDPSIYGDYTDPPWPTKTDMIINSMDMYGTATTGGDPIYFIFNIQPEICKAINRKEGIVTANGEPPQEDSPYEGGWLNPYDTALRDGGGTLTLGCVGGPACETPNELQGHLTGCFRADRPGDDMGYHFYTVLQGR